MIRVSLDQSVAIEVPSMVLQTMNRQRNLLDLPRQKSESDVSFEHVSRAMLVSAARCLLRVWSTSSCC